MISVGFERVSKNVRVGFVATDLLWLFEGQRYFHLHAHQCGLSRAIPQRWKYPRPSRDSIHHDSTNN